MMFERIAPDRAPVEACVPLGRHLPMAAAE